MSNPQPTDPMLAAPPLPTLPAKAGQPIPDASAVLAYLTAHGVAVAGDTVIVKSDGTVSVDTDDPDAALAAWASFVPAPPPPSPAQQRRADALAKLQAVKDLPGFRQWVIDVVLPRLPMDGAP